MTTQEERDLFLKIIREALRRDPRGDVSDICWEQGTDTERHILCAVFGTGVAE
jgi:hypothetical protein